MTDTTTSTRPDNDHVFYGTTHFDPAQVFGTLRGQAVLNLYTEKTHIYLQAKVFGYDATSGASFIGIKVTVVDITSTGDGEFKVEASLVSTACDHAIRDLAVTVSHASDMYDITFHTARKAIDAVLAQAELLRSIGSGPL